MTVLMLLFLIITGVDPVPGSATTGSTVTGTETTNDTTTDEGGFSVRKTPIG